MKKIEGMVALVTGASSGIGQAAARSLAKRGVHVVLTARRKDRLEKLAGEIRARKNGAEALVVPGDMTVHGEAERIAREALAWKDRVDVLVNNAGIGKTQFLEDIDPQADIRPVLELDLAAPIFLTRMLLPEMIRRQSGTIINISSVSGLTGSPTSTVYCAGKIGLNGFNDALRYEVRGMGIDVCLVCPGPVRTEFEQQIDGLPGAMVPSSMPNAIPAMQVGECIAGLVRRPKRCVIIPWYFRLPVWFFALFPVPVDWVLERVSTRPLRRDQEIGKAEKEKKSKKKRIIEFALSAAHQIRRSSSVFRPLAFVNPASARQQSRPSPRVNFESARIAGRNALGNGLHGNCRGSGSDGTDPGAERWAVAGADGVPACSRGGRPQGRRFGA
jgi:short-subunit dehydrogenase